MWTISAISYFCTLCDCTNSPINLSNESIRPAWAVPRIVVKIGLEWTFIEEKRKGWFIVLWACFSEILSQRISVFKKTGWKCCNLRELTMLPSKEEDHSTNNTFMHFNMWSKASLRHSLTLEILNSLHCFRDEPGGKSFHGPTESFGGKKAWANIRWKSLNSWMNISTNQVQTKILNWTMRIPNEPGHY